MPITLGVHTGPQERTMDDLKRLWTRADAVGFSWISVWDHFYTNPLNQRMDSYCEAGASMAVLTAWVRVGCPSATAVANLAEGADVPRGARRDSPGKAGSARREREQAPQDVCLGRPGYKTVCSAYSLYLCLSYLCPHSHRLSDDVYLQ